MVALETPRSKAEPSVVLQVSIPLSLMEALRARAEHEDRPMAHYVRIALRELLGQER